MSKSKKMPAVGLVWTEKTMKLEDLRPHERNPRKITAEQLAKLKASIQQDGFHQRLLVTPDGRVIGGHQRLKVLAELGYTEVQTLMPNRDLTEDEYKRLNVRDNLIAGDWDAEILLEDFTAEELSDFGLPDNLIPHDDSIDLQPDDTDESTTGVQGAVLTFGGNKVQMSDEEAARLDAVYKAYLDEFGVQYGFVTWLLKDKKHA